MMSSGGFEVSMSMGEQVFGKGCLQELPSRLAKYGSRAMLIGSSTARSRRQLAEVAAVLGDLCVGLCFEADTYIYPEKVKKARQQAIDVKADVIVTVGGGGPVGYGKMCVYESQLPLASVVTTYSASECTSVQSMIENGTKVMYSRDHIKPSLRIYDPLLSLNLPLNLSLASGFNAMAHACETLYCLNADPFSKMVAEEAIRVMSHGLQHLVTLAEEHSKDSDVLVEARTQCLYGAWLSLSTGKVGLGLEHKLAHVIGGNYGTPHADTHCVVLPHAVAYNSAEGSETQAAMARILRALPAAFSAGGDAAKAIYRLQKQLGAPTSLKDLPSTEGLSEAALPDASAVCITNTGRYSANPTPFKQDLIMKVLEQAWHGNEPDSALYVQQPGQRL